MSKTFTIQAATEFEEWFDNQKARDQGAVHARLDRIAAFGHFGDHHDLGDKLYELRWKNGRRIYYVYLPRYNILLLLGGDKHGQSKDIRKAKRLLSKYVE